MKGEWKCSTAARPTPEQIFRVHLPFVEFLGHSLVEEMDGNTYLSQEFMFKLTQKGKLRYNGRRGFINEVSARIQFE
jgi:hypothetical protein